MSDGNHGLELDQGILGSTTNTTVTADGISIDDGA
jgi:hypothetical protein